MGIFSDNIVPSVPSNRSWNNIGYEEWMDILNNNHRKKWDPSNMWFSDPSEYYYVPADLYKSKNQLKEYLKNRKKLTPNIEKSLNDTVQQIYSKYGVWVKWKIQKKENGFIKSVYFVKFC